MYIVRNIKGMFIIAIGMGCILFGIKDFIAPVLFLIAGTSLINYGLKVRGQQSLQQQAHVWFIKRSFRQF